MDPKADVIVDDQTFINWTRRERFPVSEDLTLHEAPAAPENPFVGKLRQITSIEIAHPGDGKAQPVRLAGDPPELKDPFAGDPTAHAISQWVIPPKLEVITSQVASTARDDLMRCQIKMS